MKTLLIFPPQWIPYNPHLAIPDLHGFLKSKGYDVNSRDLNIEFYNKILSPDFLYKSLETTFKFYNENIAQINKERELSPDLKSFHPLFQRKYQRMKEIEKIYQAREYINIVHSINNAVAVTRSKKDFYNLHKLEKAFFTIKKATEILAGLYYPSKIYFSEASALVYYSIEEILIHCQDKDGNIFYKFYEEIIEGIKAQNADFIGISIGDYTQLAPGLTLALLLKQHTKAHINIGGNLFGRYTDVIVNNPKFFELFADTIICNEGERPIAELLEALKENKSFENVSNLIYMANNTIKINPTADPIKINELPSPDFSDLPLNNYYTPELIYNIQASRNCYWCKCTFCTHHHGSKYAVKSIDKVIKEIKELKEKHNAKYFHFVDEAMSPGYLERLSKKLIEENLDIYFYIYGRFEKEFSAELFKTAYQAGLRFILWGFESANERIYTLMNKGDVIDRNARLKTLQEAFDAGVWNHLFIMFGFPSETFEEAQDTVHFLKQHRHLFSHSTGGTFVLLEDAPILKNPKKYYITKVQKIRSGFSFAHRFETYKGMKPEQLKELDKYKYEHWDYKNLKYKEIAYREKVFLYVCKYGAKNISRMKNKIWI